jgi:hypothetical protein
LFCKNNVGEEIMTKKKKLMLEQLLNMPEPFVNKPAKVQYQAFGDKFYKALIWLALLTSMSTAYLDGRYNQSIGVRFEVLKYFINHPMGHHNPPQVIPENLHQGATNA